MDRLELLLKVIGLRTTTEHVEQEQPIQIEETYNEIQPKDSINNDETFNQIQVSEPIDTNESDGLDYISTLVNDEHEDDIIEYTRSIEEDTCNSSDEHTVEPHLESTYVKDTEQEIESEKSDTAIKQLEDDNIIEHDIHNELANSVNELNTEASTDVVIAEPEQQDVEVEEKIIKPFNIEESISDKYDYNSILDSLKVEQEAEHNTVIIPEIPSETKSTQSNKELLSAILNSRTQTKKPTVEKKVETNLADLLKTEQVSELDNSLLQIERNKLIKELLSHNIVVNGYRNDKRKSFDFCFSRDQTITKELTQDVWVEEQEEARTKVQSKFNIKKLFKRG